MTERNFVLPALAMASPNLPQLMATPAFYFKMARRMIVHCPGEIELSVPGKVRQ